MEFYGTIGPACADLETLRRMVDAGMTGIRMNLSHGPLAAHAASLMLTGETAAGHYPAEAMEYLVRTARTALESAR